jgi:HTH DNA binding domain
MDISTEVYALGREGAGPVGMHRRAKTGGPPTRAHRRSRAAVGDAQARFRALRRQGVDESYSAYRIAIQLPKSALGSYFTLLHPELRVELVNRMEVGPELLLAEARLTGPRAGDWAEQVQQFPGVREVAIQPEGPTSAVYRILLSAGVVQKIVQKHRVLARYPIVMESGWMRFETVATPSQIRPFLRDLVRRAGPSHVESVRRRAVSLRTLGLTPSQDAVFRAALSAGYFSVPRGISVSGLAGRLGRSKSNTSEILSRIQRRLAESALQLDMAPIVATS